MPKIICLRIDDTLPTAKMLMETTNIRHLPVTEDDLLVGIVSNRDLLKHAALLTSSLSEKILVKDVMSDILITIKEDCPISEAAKVMIDHRVDSLPIVDGEGRLLGLVTSFDFLTYVKKLQDDAPISSMR